MIANVGSVTNAANSWAPYCMPLGSLELPYSHGLYLEHSFSIYCLSFSVPGCPSTGWLHHLKMGQSNCCQGNPQQWGVSWGGGSNNEASQSTGISVYSVPPGDPEGWLSVAQSGDLLIDCTWWAFLPSPSSHPSPTSPLSLLEITSHLHYLGPSLGPKPIPWR